jgi:hypothetical protein
MILPPKHSIPGDPTRVRAMRHPALRPKATRNDGIGDKLNFAGEYWVDKAVEKAAIILERIDKRFPQT